jgi:hypothetical protein
MGHVDNADRMANTYTASCWTLKRTKKLFFHLFDLDIVNNYILLSSSGGRKVSHRDFRLALIREMLARSGHEPRPSKPVGRPPPASTNIRRLDTCHNKHWPDRNPTRRRCHVFSARGMTRMVMFKCVKCAVALCEDWSCFADYHTKNNLYDIFSSVLHANSWSLDHNVSKKTCIFSFVETYLFHCAIRALQHFTVSWAMSDSFPTNCFLFHKFILLCSRIFRFFEKHAQNLNAPRNTSVSWDLQMGFNSVH